MTFTDKEAKRLLRQVNFPELEENIDIMEEEDREERSDMQILADEASYLLDMFSEGGNIFSEDLEESREWLKNTSNGKSYRFDHIPTPQEIAHCENETLIAKGCVNSYNRLNRLVKRLENMGY